MRVRDKIAEMIAGDYIQQKIRENIPASDRHKDDAQWRPLTARPVNRDLNPLKQIRMQQIAWWLYDRNPMARRIVEMTKDFVVGEGIIYHATEPKVKDVLDEHWNDPVNAWNLKQEQKAKEIGLYGEQFYPVFVNNENGHVRLGYVDPSLVWKVEANPENIEQIEKIRVRRTDLMGVGSRDYDVIHIDENPESKTFGLWVGEIFQFAINKVSNALRGRSDLLSLADWIDVYERYLFNRGERAELINSFVWDIQLDGLNDKEIDEWLKKQKLPKPGSMRAHNEKVKWTAETTTLESSDASGEARMYRNHILAGAGLPPHWFAGGEGITRATALEMGTPAFKMLKSRQRYFKYMIEHIFKFVIDQKVIHGVLPKDIDKTFSVALPKIVAKDVVSLATALSGASTSLQIAVEQDWISNSSAAKTYAFLLSQLGVEITSEEEENKVKEEIKNEEDPDYENQKVLAEAMRKLKEKKENEV